MTKMGMIRITDAPGGRYRWMVEDPDGNVIVISHETWPEPGLAETDARAWHHQQTQESAQRVWAEA